MVINQSASGALTSKQGPSGGGAEPRTKKIKIEKKIIINEQSKEIKAINQSASGALTS